MAGNNGIWRIEAILYSPSYPAWSENISRNTLRKQIAFRLWMYNISYFQKWHRCWKIVLGLFSNSLFVLAVILVFAFSTYSKVPTKSCSIVSHFPEAYSHIVSWILTYLIPTVLYSLRNRWGNWVRQECCFTRTVTELMSQWEQRMRVSSFFELPLTL